MHEAVLTMLGKYDLSTRDSAIHALREVLQEVALLGLWRARFFEHAAFYGGTALRILHGHERFSEDLDFTLLQPTPDSTLSNYFSALTSELLSLGFGVTVQAKEKRKWSAIQSAFLKTDTRSHLLALSAQQRIVDTVAPNHVLRIRLEIDTNPPGYFKTETRFLFQPIPFSVRSCSLPDLFAGKMHAVLCREWKTRVKGRDWYDFVWFAGNHPDLHLRHLEERMKQSGHWEMNKTLTESSFRERLSTRIESLNIDAARSEALPFILNPDSVSIWSKEFFHAAARRIHCV